MTDYRFSVKTTKSGVNKWQGVLAFFIIGVLVFAIITGLIKSFSLKNKVSSSGWDGISSFVLALKDSPNSLFIFQSDPKRVVFIQAGKIGSHLNVNAVAETASVVFGAKISNYFNLGGLTEDQARKKFDDFTSFLTPFKILTTGWGGGSTNTNISRYDAIKLWWQLKSIRSKDLDFIDLTAFNASDKSRGSSKVLGATSDYLNKEIRPYLENTRIIQEDLDIHLVNSTSDDRASSLASNFISAVGGSVVSVDGDTTIRQRCVISTNDSQAYTVNYLAKVFECDIKDGSQTDDKPNATIYLGQDFPERYF